ncbi:hypothetical protein BGW80DRAFT_917017 [Lactifluus volemus]|nr:hypothetical protein BGW80DRAFT_917017 [Lactifluus volemus]
MFSAAESNTASSVDGYQGSRTRSSWASVPTVSPGLSPPPDLAPPPSLPPSPDLPPPWDLSSLSCLQPPPGAPFSSHESCPYDHAGRGPRFSSIISSPDGQQIFSIDGDDIKHATTGTIDGNMSTSVSEHDSQRENTLHPEKGSTPYITANEAYTHALRMETPLQDALAIIGFSGEYILQVGFNPIALQEGLLIEEIYLSLNGDLPFLNDQPEHETFASIFTPFPGVVCTKEHVYYLPVDPLAHGYPHLSSLGGFKVRTANNSASASASASASGGGSPGSDESGNGDLRGKGKSREDRPGAEGGGEGGKDEGDDASDVSGKPGGGDSTPDPGFHITLKSMLSIKTGSTVSHDVTTRVNAAVMRPRSLAGSKDRSRYV